VPKIAAMNEVLTKATVKIKRCSFLPHIVVEKRVSLLVSRPTASDTRLHLNSSLQHTT